MPTTVSPDQLTALCRSLFDDLDVTKTEVAERLDVTDGAVHHMLNPEKSMRTLSIRFLEEFGGKDVEGPVYIVEDE